METICTVYQYTYPAINVIWLTFRRISRKIYEHIVGASTDYRRDIYEQERYTANLIIAR